MMSQEQNDEITLSGPGTPTGELLRRYWMPAALSEELNGQRPLVPVTLLGERLVLFRSDRGDLSLIERHCPHRGADLCFGRLENGGIRCPFHGWHFDSSGQCTEQPAEPVTSTMYKKVRVTAYRVTEKNGIIWAYLGSDEPPAFPALDCYIAPSSHVFSFKGLWECNWLQALEVGIDPAHASFLHRFLEDEDPEEGYGKQFRDSAADTGIPITKILREFPRPDINVSETEYGLRIISIRDLNNGSSHVRVTNQVFPCAITIPMSNEMNITQWHVPIDDHNCYWYSMFTSFSEPVDKKLMREQRLKEHTLPAYAPTRNSSNSYGYNSREQESLTYTGMGSDINVHDQWACESMGPIQDRTREQLCSSDTAIIHYRRMLRKAIKTIAETTESDSLPLRVSANEAAQIRGPIAVDAVASSDDLRNAWLERDAQRRESCPWIRESAHPEATDGKR